MPLRSPLSPLFPYTTLFRSVWAAALLLGVTCFVVYNANLRTIGAGDTLASRYLPLIVWHHHTLGLDHDARLVAHGQDRKSTRLNSSHVEISYAVFCLKKKKH